MTTEINIFMGIWCTGLCSIIIPIIIMYVDMKKTFALVKRAKVAGYIVMGAKGPITLSGEDYIVFIAINLHIPLMVQRVYVSTYLWSVQVVGLIIFLDTDFFYVFSVVIFTNISFVLIFRGINEFIYTKNFTILARRMPIFMMIPLLDAFQELICIPGIILGDILYGVAVLFVSFYFYKIYIYIVCSIFIWYLEFGTKD